MLRAPRTIFVLFVVCASLARAAFLAPNAFDPLQVVPPPPAPDSIVAESERLTLTLLAQNRTPAQAALAQHWEKYDPFKLVQAVLGDWATPHTLPKLAAFFKASFSDTKPYTERAKNAYARPRPHLDNPSLPLAIAKPEGPAYPSGHATAAALHAAILTAAWPDCAGDCAHVVDLVCLSRLYGGAHYPSDVVAGRRLGETIAREMLKSPETQEALSEIRSELAAAIAAHRKAA